MKLRHLFFLFLVIFYHHSYAQPLIINEVSQGSSGNKEYVELLVIGNPYCGSTVPTVDLRGYILDDNNGTFRSGTSRGIAAGHMRFKNIPFWQNVPQGTIIVIYNQADRNVNIPADDNSLEDGNCRLILPGNSTLFESTTSLPSVNNSNFNPNSSTYSQMAATGWNTIMGMRGDGDSFQIRTPNGQTIVHAVSWGDNDQNNVIYFSGSASGKVYSFTNTFTNNASTQSNWTSGNSLTDETPGAPNNPANASYIANMNPNCGNTPSTNIEINGTTTSTGCEENCTGSITVAISGGTTPYSYNWSNGATTQNLTNICAGTYTLEVTDNAGCTNTEQFTISATGNLVLTPTLQHETCVDVCNGSISITPTGVAPHTYNWSNGATTSSITNLCDGIYTVNVTDATGCTATLAQVINGGTTPPDATITGNRELTTNVTNNQLTANRPVINWTADCQNCINEQGIFNASQAGPGIHQICVVTGTQECNTTDCITINVIQPTPDCTPNQLTLDFTLCPGEIYTHENIDYNQAGTFTFNYLNIGGCDSTITINLNYFTLPSPILHSLCLYDSLELNGNYINNDTTFILQQTTLDGCTYNQTYTIEFNDCEPDNLTVFIPNVFTPNDDNVNDLFEIFINDGLLKEGFIFNRWGQIIHQFEKNETTWNGITKNGSFPPDGVYTYYIIVEEKGGNNHKYHGFVTIIK